MWLQWVTEGYRRLPSGYSGLPKVRVVTEGYSKLQQVTEWLHCITAGFSQLRGGYSGLQEVTEG